ncbi:MAG: nucleotide exchange factor GrpE [Bacteroidales bacterium]|nr:MAG: nucleotide exchange factor GrpE [Bacteroidales bacterium]
MTKKTKKTVGSEVKKEDQNKDRAGKEETVKEKAPDKEKDVEITDEEPETAGEEPEEEKKSEEQIKNELQEKYLRLSADFDNYRKRTLKERMDLIKLANEELLLNLLPVMDDFERALQSMEKTTDCKALKQGIDLIYNKFKDFLNASGVKEINAVNEKFNTDLHEAVTQIPAPAKKMKGKVVDVIEKGYLLNDKVIRFSKVVIGE